MRNRSDAQNVHDHGVSSALKVNARKVLESAGNSADPEAVSSALDAVTDAVLFSDQDQVTKEAALRLLDDLRLPRFAPVHSQINASAPQVLAAVWAVVERFSGASEERRRDLANVFCTQLASGIEKNLAVCLSGKISRILGVLDGQEDIAEALGLRAAMPMWVVREELRALASKVSEEAEDGEAGEAEFRRRAFAEYVEKLGLSEAIVGHVVDEFAQGF